MQYQILSIPSQKTGDHDGLLTPWLVYVAHNILHDFYYKIRKRRNSQKHNRPRAFLTVSANVVTL
jgi:hypothetical protein